MSTSIRLALSLLLGLALASTALADRLITADGRILELKKARKLADGSYSLIFESGEIRCPAERVASVEIEGDMSDYVPANEDEKKKLADGYVRYSGKWLSRSAYQAELKKESDRTRARTTELAAHSKFYDGWKKETKHFTLQSNTSPEILDGYADLLEAYYDQMDSRVGIDPSPVLKKTKMKVSIYKSRAEFTEITKSPPGVAGFFNFVDGELHFYHDYQDPSVSQWISLHEGTHLLTFLIEPQSRPQIWINEGVADYFGSAEVTRNKRGKLEILPGQLSLERILTVQQAIQEDKCIPLETLFNLGREQFHAFEYAHAWSFVYFLNTAKPEYEKAFKRFFKDFYTLAKGVSYTTEPGGGNRFGSWKIVPPQEVRRLLLERLGLKDVTHLEEEWKAYIAAIPIDAPRARFQRALQSLFQGGPEGMPRALEDLDAAIGAGVSDARAFWARAILLLATKGDAEGAEKDLRRAIEIDPLGAAYRASLAQLLAGLDLFGPGTVLRFGEEDVDEVDDEALAEAETELGLACELAPENDFLRESRDTLLDLLAKKSAGK